MGQSRSLADAGVSAREAEVLDALGEHLTNAEIAARLYISVRTVESHVSSLLRKLGLSDRRELAQLAAELATSSVGPGLPVDADRPGPGAGGPVGPVGLDRVGPLAGRSNRMPGHGGVIPSPLTTFVGRAQERAALASAIAEHRLVTAVGPGGVGKTRLALAVAADVADRYTDGAWFVDLVPVTDPAMIASCLASVLGLGEVTARSADDTVAAALADHETLLVLDNCEHVADGVAVFVERLLARCPQVVVLATSRARLLVPFERVFPVPGLSLPERPPTADRTGDADREPGDAVALFLARAAAVGSPVTSAADQRRVGAVCRALDGMALAIELAAARLPALGLDGLEAGLGDRLRLLAGGSRLDDRHSSLRAALDWSFELLDPADQAVLRRVSVFAAPFTVEAAVAVAGSDPLPAGKEAAATVDALGHLSDQSLVVAIPGSGGTRYRVLETVRQYGMSRLDETGEGDEIRRRHLGWCITMARDLEEAEALDYDRFRLAFDAVADDLRAALGWVAEQPEERAQARHVAMRLADLLYRRGLPAESQRRYEQAAALSDATAAASALHHAAGVASSRQAGEDALRLHQAAADAARDAGKPAQAACDLALVAMLANRAPGIMARLPPPVDVGAVLAEARELAGDDLRARAAVVVAEAFTVHEAEPRAADLAEQAVDMSRRAGDVLLESAALDQLTVVELARGEPLAAASTVLRRTELLAEVPEDATSAFEQSDTYHMAVEVHIGVGDLQAANRLAEPLRRLPAYREGHLGAARLLVADALAGRWERIPEVAGEFRVNWERLGRPVVAYLALGAGAVAMVHGLRGEDAARADWLDIVDRLRTAIENYGWRKIWGPTFDALVLLHRGEVDEAAARLAADPDELRDWNSGIWRQWYTALWAEAAVLSGHPEAAERLDRAAVVVAGNPIASALVDRARALVDHDSAGLLAAARALDDAGCPYQQARTLIMAGDPHQAQGAALLASLGAAPMFPTLPH